MESIFHLLADNEHCKGGKQLHSVSNVYKMQRRLRERAACVLHMCIVPCEFSSRQHAERNNNHYCYYIKHTHKHVHKL